MCGGTVPQCPVRTSVLCTWGGVAEGWAEQLEKPLSSSLEGTYRVWGQSGWRDDKRLLGVMNVTASISQLFSKMSMDQGEGKLRHGIGPQSHGNLDA